jgi:NADP-dependent 3-hydroxy acid dehydrogenase YdfG
MHSHLETFSLTQVEIAKGDGSNRVAFCAAAKEMGGIDILVNNDGHAN